MNRTITRKTEWRSEKKKEEIRIEAYKFEGQRLVKVCYSLESIFPNGKKKKKEDIVRIVQARALKRIVVGVRVSARGYFFALSQHPEILCGLFV